MKTTTSPGVWGACLLILACGPSPAPEGIPPNTEPDAVFGALEERFLEALAVRVGFHVTADGVVEADLQGELRVFPDGTIRLTALGEFAGESVDLQLLAQGGEYEYGNGPDRIAAPTPEYLREALLIGLTRMGILHNLAMLARNAPPDGADGGVGDWVQVNSFAAEEADAGGAVSDVVTFSMTVAGEPVGFASLEIGSDGIPLARRQTVRFPTGEMRVLEEYCGVSILPPSGLE